MKTALYRTSFPQLVLLSLLLLLSLLDNLIQILLFFFLKKQLMSVVSPSPLCSLSLCSDGRSTGWAPQKPLVRRDLHKPRVDPFSL